MDSVEDNSSSGVTFAIYLNDGYDNYVEYEGDVFPAKADGYKYNADISNCTDLDGNTSSNYSLYYNNDTVQVSTQESVYCYIYFDMYSYNGDYCLVNNITEYLGECALVMDDYSYTVELAKESIEEKGEADTSKIAPTIAYGKSVKENKEVDVSTTGSLTYGKNYSFNSTTGYYTISDTVNISTLTDEYIGYYTCGGSNNSCTTMYKIISYTVTDSGTSVTQKITSADVYTYVVNSTIDSENGIYITYDDDGATYYYRGSVKNNYVLFAGYYWRIIRINGDGSVRMIYAGTDANDISDDQIASSKFNEIGSDPTYVGYKYGIVSDIPIIQTTAVEIKKNANSEYLFSTGYEELGDGTFMLKSDGSIKGTIEDLFGASGTYSDNVISYYTCFKSSLSGTCYVLYKLSAYISSASLMVYYITYASTSYENTLTNENDSNIKTVVDGWYKENILGQYDEDGNGTHLLSEYISTSAIFCGDRSVYSGSGYSLLSTAYHNAYQRIKTYSPSLYCSSNSADWYSVDSENLEYPIGLITVDEIAFAGGKLSNVNALYYLYTGSEYWTMSPFYFNSSNLNAIDGYVNSTGSIGASNVTASYGVRPVINLSSNVKISQGTGTASNPFVVTLD